MNYGGVYEIVNTINSKRYVGSSVNLKKRWGEHKSALRMNKHFNIHLQRAYNKYRKGAFEFRVLVITEPKEALRLENLLIPCADYNIAKDAVASRLGVVGEFHPMYGKYHSEETKQKMRENSWIRGKHLSAETKQKISEGLTGHKCSAETKRKISEAGTGRHRSAETKQKISEGKTGHKCSAETKRKMSEARMGEKNHNWINLSKQEIERMKTLRVQGYYYYEIGEMFGVSRDTAKRRILGTQ